MNEEIRVTHQDSTDTPIYKTTTKKWMVLRGREHGNIFWTSGGDYRDDWYELMFASDDEKEVSADWFTRYYGR